MGYKICVRLQGGKGGGHSIQAHNLNHLLAMGQDDDGVNKILVTTEAVAYSAVNDDGTRQRLSFLPKEFIDAAEQGLLENYLNRHQDIQISLEVVMDFSNLNVFELTRVIGKLQLQFVCLFCTLFLTNNYFRCWFLLESVDNR